MKFDIFCTLLIFKLLSFLFQMYNYGEIKHWPPWIDVLTRLNHVLLALNSSINIVIYTAKVTLFLQRSQECVKGVLLKYFRISKT